MAKYDSDEFFKAERKMQGALGSRYVSPIQITLGEIQYRFEEDVYRATLDAGIKVDKAELIKALNYDRAQYAQGYADGLMERPFAKDTNVRSNADRIRQMDDDEMAAYLSKVQGDIFRGEMRLTPQWLDWLRQEADNAGA